TRVSVYLSLSPRAPPPSPISPLSLPDALPICRLAARDPGSARAGGAEGELRHGLGRGPDRPGRRRAGGLGAGALPLPGPAPARRSEEHTSELQSRENLVCRLLLEKKKHSTSVW